MKLVVGLGNPGKKYENTRHNIGWQLIEALRLVLDFTGFKKEGKFQSAVSEGTFQGQKIILAKPLTYMNNSGQAVGLIQRFYKINSEDILIIRDDLDLEFGKYREKQNSSSGGHNGINSIINQLGSKNFTQAKIGIKNELLPKMDPTDFVLKKFTRAEKQELENLLPEYVLKIEKHLLANINIQTPNPK